MYNDASMHHWFDIRSRRSPLSNVVSISLNRVNHAHTVDAYIVQVNVLISFSYLCFIPIVLIWVGLFDEVMKPVFAVLGVVLLHGSLGNMLCFSFTCFTCPQVKPMFHRGDL